MAIIHATSPINIHKCYANANILIILLRVPSVFPIYMYFRARTSQSLVQNYWKDDFFCEVTCIIVVYKLLLYPNVLPRGFLSVLAIQRFSFCTVKDRLGLMSHPYLTYWSVLTVLVSERFSIDLNKSEQNNEVSESPNFYC